ncbi:hypothetical protein CALCODRAFT_502406 [Calocera cornea HHB12733]|uniref:Uncharacterized protein n=1 Tax=Calocera cornea HHB12733 TaxID=1353952 RepID=A0A165D9J5_9BASI|nr:hypothetical protein CALCODRAFT_502406 [Calocera cornea HHB12733]
MPVVHHLKCSTCVSVNSWKYTSLNAPMNTPRAPQMSDCLAHPLARQHAINSKNSTPHRVTRRYVT